MDTQTNTTQNNQEVDKNIVEEVIVLAEKAYQVALESKQKTAESSTELESILSELKVLVEEEKVKNNQ